MSQLQLEFLLLVKYLKVFGITPVGLFIRNRQAMGNGSISIIVYSIKFYSG
jgi:hypothetical protein